MNSVKEAALAAEKKFLEDLVMSQRGNLSASAREARMDRSNFKRLLRKHRITVVREGDLAGGSGTDE